MSVHLQVLPNDLPVAVPTTDDDHFEKTNYTETGVPMILVGEDMSSGLAASPVVKAMTDPLARHFSELANSLVQRKPVIELDDVAWLLEVLAKRYFTAPAHASHEISTDRSADEFFTAIAHPVLTELAAGISDSRTIRLINFHATPRYREAEYREQIALLAQVFEPITPANFADAVAGRWAYERPGLMPALFEGYRDNFDVLLPILEEFGFTGWFFVPSCFLGIPPHEQRSYAARHQLFLAERDEYPDERIALTWDEARAIVGRGHAFACHTRTHSEVTPDTPRDVLENEIVAAKAEMEAELGVQIDIFCWLEGAAVGVNPEADAMLRTAGFRYLFSNFKIQRLQ